MVGAKGEVKAREGKEGRSIEWKQRQGGYVQVLTINTPGLDEEERRKLREEIVFLMTWNPKELALLPLRPCQLSALSLP